jgi:hypothetical protein
MMTFCPNAHHRHEKRVALTQPNPEEMGMAKKVSGEQQYEYKCGDYVAGCPVVIKSNTAASTALLASQHVNSTHSGKNVTVESISDDINPIFIR